MSWHYAVLTILVSASCLFLAWQLWVTFRGGDPFRSLGDDDWNVKR